MPDSSEVKIEMRELGKRINELSFSFLSSRLGFYVLSFEFSVPRDVVLRVSLFLYLLQ